MWDDRTMSSRVSPARCPSKGTAQNAGFGRRRPAKPAALRQETCGGSDRRAGLFPAGIAMALLLAGCSQMAPRLGDLRPVAPATHEDVQRLRDATDRIAELEYAEALMIVAPLGDRFDAAGDLRRAGEARFWHAYCAEKLGRTDEAIAVYQRVIEFYPDTPASRQASRRLGGIERVVPPPPAADGARRRFAPPTTAPASSEHDGDAPSSATTQPSDGSDSDTAGE